MPTEIELKLSAAGITADDLDKQPVVRDHCTGTYQVHHLDNIYFDTPDLRLNAAGIGLRLRHNRQRWLQTAKTSGNVSNGLHQRSEWEMPVSGEALELERFDAPELRHLFENPDIVKALQPLFRTDFERTTWNLCYTDDTLIEMVLDQGRIEANGKLEAISEIELELMSGNTNHLFDVARALAKSLPVQALNLSKAARGYHLGGYSTNS